MKTRAECLAEYGSDYLIEKKIEKGELFKVGKGIYSEKKYVPEIAVFVYKYPNTVVTMKSAFFFYGLTDVIPEECDLATTFSKKELKQQTIKAMIYGFTTENVCLLNLCDIKVNCHLTIIKKLF